MLFSEAPFDDNTCDSGIFFLHEKFFQYNMAKSHEQGKV